MSKRFFSFTLFSLFGLILVLAMISDVFEKVSRKPLESHFHQHNILIAKVLRNSLMQSDLRNLLSDDNGYLLAKSRLSPLDTVLQQYLQDIPVVKIKVFNRRGLTVYSSTKSDIGSDAKYNQGVTAALRGESIGSMVHRDRFNSFDGVIEDRDLYQQYIPIVLKPEGEAEGVFEIYSDVTSLVGDINSTQKTFVYGLIAVLGTFFLIQVWLYYLTDWALISEKAQTDKYLKELEKNTQDLEKRVKSRTRELESSRFFLQSVIDGIASPLFVIKPDLRVSLMNKAARELIPANAPESEYTHCYQISHRRDTPCDGIDHPCSFNEVMTRQNRVVLQHNHYDADNRKIIVDVISTPLYDRDGELSGIIEVEHDVTELVTARQELAQSEERLQSIVDHVPDAILTLDPNGKIESVNKAATRMFNLPADHLLGHRLQNLIFESKEISLMNADAGVREAKALNGSKGKFPVDLWVGGLQYGSHGRYVAVVRDIRERKFAERQLELTRQQYYHQEKMAAIGQLAAGILHEVGNPIAAIAGAAQDMRLAENSLIGSEGGSGLDKAVDRNLIMIEEHTERLAKITRDIASFASPKTREKELVDINNLIRSTTRLLGYDHRFRGVSVNQILDPRLPAVEAVPDQITQILMNLIINAIDATQAKKTGNSQVNVISRLCDNGIEIEVWDNGVGMSEDVLEHAFEPFYTTKEPGSGTGLGLSLCESIVTAHGGKMWVSSRQGDSTSIFVFLPSNFSDNE